jgi:hypothetical protein
MIADVTMIPEIEVLLSNGKKAFDSTLQHIGKLTVCLTWNNP